MHMYNVCILVTLLLKSPYMHGYGMLADTGNAHVQRVAGRVSK